MTGVITALFASYVMLWMLVLLLCVVMLIVLRYLAVIFRNNQPATMPPVLGRQLSGQALVNEVGERLDLTGPSDRPTMVFIASPGCGGCDALMSGVREDLVDGVRRGWRFVVVMRNGQLADAKEFRRRHGLDVVNEVTVALDPVGDGCRSWGVEATPTALVLDRDGRVISFAGSPKLAWVGEQLQRRQYVGDVSNGGGTVAMLADDSELSTPRAVASVRHVRD